MSLNSQSSFFFFQNTDFTGRHVLFLLFRMITKKKERKSLSYIYLLTMLINKKKVHLLLKLWIERLLFDQNKFIHLPIDIDLSGFTALISAPKRKSKNVRLSVVHSKRKSTLGYSWEYPRVPKSTRQEYFFV